MSITQRTIRSMSIYLGLAGVIVGLGETMVKFFDKTRLDDDIYKPLLLAALFWIAHGVNGLRSEK